MVIRTFRSGNPEKISPRMRQHDDNKSKSWMLRKRKQLQGEKFRSGLRPRKKNAKMSSRQVVFYRIPATKISFFPPVYISRGQSLTEVRNSEQ